RTDNILGRLLVIRGELARGHASLERAMAAAEPASGPIWDATPLERLVSIGLMACASAFRGRFAEAEAAIARGRALALAPAHAAAAFYRALIAHTRGDWSDAVAHADEGIAAARAAANLIYEYVSHVYLGLALARQGRVADGLIAQQAALALAERAQTRVILGR